MEYLQREQLREDGGAPEKNDTRQDGQSPLGHIKRKKSKVKSQRAKVKSDEVALRALLKGAEPKAKRACLLLTFDS